MLGRNSVGDQPDNNEGLVASSGVSFAGKSLKLDTEEDAQEVVEEILRCQKLQYLDLEGNTLGPDAAKAVSTAIEQNGAELKRALWKDMFTGRMKNEIPVALKHLGNGLCMAQTQLVELDLSDNAFGPIGVQGLAELLRSAPCYTLKELRLNNNGLGITGGKMLAQALTDCYSNSCSEGGQPFALKVFIAGRNRLENDGAKALADVFERLKSLEEVQMPQNGIYHVGIAALSKGLSANKNLKILNLNDNTITVKGARALAKALPNLQSLEKLNLGDCMLKTAGAIVLAEILGEDGSHPALTEVNLSFNEIHMRGITPIAEAMADKQSLTYLQLDGNEFGSEGCEMLRQLLASSNKIDALQPLDEVPSEAESEESDNEEAESGAEETGELEDNDDEVQALESEEEQVKNGGTTKIVTVASFLKDPTGEKLLLLQDDNLQGFVEHAKKVAENSKDISSSARYAEEFSRIIMKVSSLCESGFTDVRVKADSLADSLYQELFAFAAQYEQTSAVNNALMVHLGLMKGENRITPHVDWNLEGCFKALEKVCQKQYFPAPTKEILKYCIDHPNKPTKQRYNDASPEIVDKVKAALSS